MNDDINLYIAFNLVFGILLLAGYIYLAIIQTLESLRPKDWLTGLRYRILGVLILTVITLVPSLVYQSLRLNGEEFEFLRNIVTVTSRINSIGTLIILISIFRYKRSDK